MAEAMNIYDSIKTRRSVRQYQGTPVPPEKLKRIWEAVRWAPSACNLQPWCFLLIKSPAMRERTRRVLQDWVVTAPLVVVALGNREKAWRRDGVSIHAVDVAIAMEHLVLAAAAEGLGTCWICAYHRQALQDALGIAPEWEAVAVTPLGYADDPSPRTDRKPLADIVREI
jgi:nitroreductase